MTEQQLWTVLVPAAFGLAGIIVGAVVKTFLDRRVALDASLLAARQSAYKKLWELTGVVPKYPRATEVTPERLEEFSRELRTWYYVRGGIYLSSAAQEKYVDVQKLICKITKPVEPCPGVAKKGGGSWLAQIIRNRYRRRIEPKSERQLTWDEQYCQVADACSAVRTELTKDLLSRRGASRWI